ncbi:hypothetical protein, partial [Klebsiella pneumoniae]|uniref:hypothetical protein n=1 Tax=Klebsiella pneumoniae TaxID=573 RepID=UPI003F526E9C
TAQYEALLWSKPNNPDIIDPSVFDIVRGSLGSGTLSSLFSIDGNALTVLSGKVAFSADYPTQIVLIGTSPTLTPSALQFSLTAKVQLQNIGQ